MTIIGILTAMAVTAVIVSLYVMSSDFIKVETMPDGESSTLPDGSIDSDGDKIPDHLDECPKRPENLDQYADDDGCPEDLESFERCVQIGGRVWPTENGCTDEYGIHLLPSKFAKQKCEERDGDFRMMGEVWQYVCIVPPSDAGKICTDSSQCREVCQAETKESAAGMCAGYNDIGCYFWEMKDGKIIEHCRVD